MLGQRRAYSDLFFKYLLFTGAEGNKSYSEKWIINNFMSLRKKLISCILIGEIGALSFLFAYFHSRFYQFNLQS